MTGEELMYHYANRPAQMKGQRVGQWFCNAFKLTDNQLYNALTASEAKRLIAARYDTYDVAFLIKYNLSRSLAPAERQPLHTHSKINPD